MIFNRLRRKDLEDRLKTIRELTQRAMKQGLLTVDATAKINSKTLENFYMIKK
jgi:flagellar motor component MotA